jgi:hypothetical protein
MACKRARCWTIITGYEGFPEIQVSYLALR